MGVNFFNNHEYDFMKKASKGCEILREETSLAYDLARRGMIRLGYDDETKFCETASLTDTGDFIFREDRINRIPFIGVLYNIYGPLFAP